MGWTHDIMMQLSVYLKLKPTAFRITYIELTSDSVRVRILKDCDPANQVGVEIPDDLLHEQAFELH